MQRTPPVDDLVYPPFDGFPKEGLEFLKRLKRNNNRPWFQKHRTEYEESVRFPMQCLIAALRERMKPIAPEMEFHPKRSIFRINRDVRFSKDKAPYKTNIAASFDLRGEKSPVETPGLYVGITPGEIFIGGGLYMPSGAQLKAIRTSMAENSADYLAIVTGRRFRRVFGEVQGDMLSRAPLGYPPDHPMIEHLRHKQFYIGVELEDRACLRPKFVDTVVSVFSDTMPLVRWLLAALR
jgi:uncharacterized protein (TIGR02453 family)